MSKRKVGRPRGAARRSSLWSLGVAVALGVLGLALLFVLLTRPGGGAPLTTDRVPRLSPQAALEMVERGEGVLIDTRSLESYTREHAAGALWFPSNEVQERMAELPESGALIFY